MILGYSIKDILAVIGAVVVVLTVLKLLLEVVPRFNQLRANVYSALNSKVKHKSLEKRAIASNIENVVNQSVSSLRKELPSNWISRARIEWVEEETIDELEEDELILRIRPIENQDRNLMNGIYYFFTKALFPGVKEVVPKVPKKAAVLQLSRRTISMNHPYVIREFEKGYLEPAIQAESEIAYYLGNYETLDQRGFFTSAYLREIAELADSVRYSEKRTQIEQELRDILTHMVTFIRESSNIPDELWYRKSDTCCYGFLLVAKPSSRSVDGYVNRANYHIENGISRLYLLGANQEKSFVRRVIRAIANQTKFNLEEIFELNKDYRGETGGICAIFNITTKTEETDKTLSNFFGDQANTPS